MSLHRQTPATRRRQAPHPRRPDRRRQVRLDVPGAGAAHARRASGGHRRPRRPTGASEEPGARRLERRAVGSRYRTTPRCVTATRLGHRRLAALVKPPGIDIVVECTGSPVHAVDHCLAAFAERKHVVNVTVEADAFCGPLLARQRGRGRRDLLARLRRPAGDDLRPGRLGAHLRLSGGGGRARPQVAAALTRNRRPTPCGSTGACRPSRQRAAA